MRCFRPRNVFSVTGNRPASRRRRHADDDRWRARHYRHRYDECCHCSTTVPTLATTTQYAQLILMCSHASIVSIIYTFFFARPCTILILYLPLLCYDIVLTTLATVCWYFTYAYLSYFFRGTVQFFFIFIYYIFNITTGCIV